MAKIQFKFYNQAQGSLFPSYLGEKIPSDHPVRLLSGIVDSLDLSELYSTYKDFGCPSYHPKMMLKVVFWGYMNNQYSCRRIADALLYDVRYMWLSGSQTPSFSTVNRFRSGHMKDIVNGLFVQIVSLLVEMGQVTLEEQYIDGTKMESVANKYTFVWRKTVERNKAKLEEKIRSLLAQIDEGIAQDNAAEASSDQPDVIDTKLLSEKIAAINARARRMPRETKEEKKAAKEVEKQARELERKREKLAEYEQHLETMGERNSYSKTDPDATFMRMKEDAMNNGQTKPGYNVQIATQNQYILNMGFYWNPADTTTFPDFVMHGLEMAGRLPKSICADSGYGSEENYELMEDLGIEAYVKYNWFHKEQHRPFREDIFRQENLYYDKEGDYYVCPMGQHMTHCGTSRKQSDTGYISYIDHYRAQRCEGCPLRGQCYKSGEDRRTIKVNHHLNSYKQQARDRLTSEEGLRHRSNRPTEPEAVFGQIKFDCQYRRFRHRGKDKVYMDFAILAMAFNLRKLFRRAAEGVMKRIEGTIRGKYEPHKAVLRHIAYKNDEWRIAA